MSSSQHTKQGESTTQRSLDTFSDCIVIEKNENGGWKTVVDDVPTSDADNNISVEEVTSPPRSGDVKYPIERDHCTIARYRKRKSYTSPSYNARYSYKAFDIDIDRHAESDEAERLEEVVDQVGKLQSLSEEINKFDTYDDVVENSALIREYEATRRTVKRMWEKNSVSGSVIASTARDFEVDQMSPMGGFFRIPGPHNEHVQQLLSDELKKQGFGGYSTPWGGFIVQPENFSEVYEIVKPVYQTPDTEPILQRI